MIFAPNSFSLAIRHAIISSARGDSAAALELFARAAQAEPNSAVPHYLKAAEHAALGQIEQAEYSFANALLIQPGMSMARFQLGLLQYSSGRTALALLTWQSLMELGPKHALPHFIVAFDALTHDRFDEARTSFVQGIRLNTENPALNADMQKAIASIDELQLSNAESKMSAEKPLPDAETSHVLLTNYQQHGPAH